MNKQVKYAAFLSIYLQVHWHHFWAPSKFQSFARSLATCPLEQRSWAPPLHLPLPLWCVSGVEPVPGRQPRPSAPSIEQWAGRRTETMTGSREGADVFCGKRYMFTSVRDDITRQDRESCRWLAALLSQGHWHAADLCCGPVMPTPVTGNPRVTAR